MTKADLSVARLLARHFNDMRGLRHVLVGVLLAVMGSAYLLMPDDTVGIMVLVLVAFVGTVAVINRLDRYYAREFGRVPASGRRGYLVGAAIGLTGAIDSHAPGLPSLVFALIAIWRLWIVWDCWPFRKYQLFTAAAAEYVSVTHMRLPTTPPFVWLAQGLLALSWTIVTTGIADHLLLTRLMKRQRDAIALPAGRAGEVDPR
jgi:hypothetical protein